MYLASIIAYYGLIIELFLIVFIVFLTYLLKWIYIVKTNNKNKLINQLEDFINNKMILGEEITEKEIRKEWNKIDILLLMIKKFETQQHRNNWGLIKMRFIRSILLPLARNATVNPDWTYRLYAAEAFAIFAENHDNIYIEKLLYDKIPLVSYTAANASIKYGTEKAINFVITRMASESWLTRTLYTQSFDEIPEATHYYLKNRIINSTDESVIATCYIILLKYQRMQINWDINLHIQSENLGLKLSAIQFLVRNQRELAVQSQKALLHDERWQVRAVFLSCLRGLNVNDILPEITRCLEDVNWWVRLAATQIIGHLGLLGGEALVVANIKNDLNEMNVAESVLNNYGDTR